MASKNVTVDSVIITPGAGAPARRDSKVVRDSVIVYAGGAGPERDLLRELRPFDDIPSAQFTLNGVGRIVYVNPAWSNMTGYSREESAGRPFTELLTLEYVNCFAENLSKFVASGEMHHLELEVIRKDGSPLPVSFDCKTVSDREGKVRLVHCVLFDISGHRQTEAELQKKLSATHGRLDKANSELAAANERLKVEASERKRLEGELERQRESAQRSEGELNVLRDSMQKLEGENKRLGEVNEKLNREIYEVQAANEELKKANAGFENEMAERTAELLRASQDVESQLSQRTEELARANEEIKRLQETKPPEAPQAP